MAEDYQLDIVHWTLIKRIFYVTKCYSLKKNTTLVHNFTKIHTYTHLCILFAEFAMIS